jgi:hypothetical protein
MRASRSSSAVELVTRTALIVTCARKGQMIGKTAKLAIFGSDDNEEDNKMITVQEIINT